MSLPTPSFKGRTLSWRLREGVLEVTLHRAPCNEIGTATLRDLERLAEVVRDGAFGAHALLWHSSVERGFCAGADLRELASGLQARHARLGTLLGPVKRRLSARGQRAARRLASPLIRREIRAFLDRIHAVFNTLDAAPLVTIAAVHRVCFGGGFELALTADLIVADKTARFCFPELRLGLIPGFGGVPRLERELGNAVVRDLLLTGRSLNASRAQQLGLVSQLVAPGQALSAARSIARQVGRFDGPTVVQAKRFLKPIPRARLEAEKDLFCQLITGPQVQRALADFVHTDRPMSYLPPAAGSPHA